ncbi:recombinase family protein [Paenibacillus sp. TY11]|uniref:recombinase family protein n=1 Tax=Paenibacillus sp. TY11 TaxID=3448633 RepID=UPI004039B95D
MRPFQDDINCTNQLEVLKEVPCDSLHAEEHSSPKKRAVLQKMLNQLQPGDTVVVTRLFSFADSTKHLAELLDQLHGQQAFTKE